MATGTANIGAGSPTVFAYDSVTMLSGWFDYGWFTSPWFGTYPEAYTFNQASRSYVSPAVLTAAAEGDRELLRIGGKDIVSIAGIRFYRKIAGLMLGS